MALSLADVRTVLTVPRKIPRRKDAQQAEVDYVSARVNFFNRTTPATWAQLVDAARRLHAEVKKAGGD